MLKLIVTRYKQACILCTSLAKPNANKSMYRTDCTKHMGNKLQLVQLIEAT